MPRYSLKRSPWYEHHLAGRLVGSGEQPADHHRVRTGGDRLRDVARGRMPPSAISGTPWSAAACAQSWIAVTCGTPTPDDDARRADRSRADSDLHRVRARVDQRLRSLARGDVAGDDLDRVPRLIAAHRLEHVRRVAVSGVDDEHVHSRLDQRLRALERIVADADGGADAKPTLLVLRRVRMLDLLLDVLDRDQALAAGRRRRPRAASRSCCGAGSPRPRASVVPTGAVTRLRAVITSETGCVTSSSKRRSRLVRMPTSTSSASMIGTPLMWYVRISSSASDTCASGVERDRVDDHARLAALDLVHLARPDPRSRGSCG